MPTPSPTGGRLRLPYLPTNATVGFLVAVVAVLVIAAFSYGSLQSTASARARVTQAFTLLDSLQSLLSTLQDAETGQRGFLLTGNEVYLQPYTSAQAALPGTLASIRTAVRADAVQRDRLETLVELTTQKMDELQQTITLRRAGDNENALSIIRSDRGKALMDRIRGIQAEMASRSFLRGVRAGVGIRAR